MLEYSVVHLPIFSLFAGGFNGLRGQHGIRMDRNQWEMMEFQPDLCGITVQNFLYDRMKCAAARALIVTKFH